MQMFSDPTLLAKIAGNESTKHLLADPTFMAKLQQIQRNPALAQQEVMQDPRFISIIAMLLNIQMPGTGGPGPSSSGEPMQTDEPVFPFLPRRPFSELLKTVILVGLRSHANISVSGDLDALPTCIPSAT